MRGIDPVLATCTARDKFAVFDLPRRFELDLADLEQRYRELAKVLHPDRFAKAAARERAMSMQATTALNDAYRTLRQPVARAEYLLALEGFPIGENEVVDPEFLDEVMQLREGYEEFKGDAAKVAATTASTLAARDATLARAEAALAQGAFADAKTRLIELRYYQRFLDALQGEAA